MTSAFQSECGRSLASILQGHWRKSPLKIRRFYEPEASLDYWRSAFERWCAKCANSRVYVNSPKEQFPKAYHTNNGGDAFRIYRQYAAPGESRITVLLNCVERADRSLARMRDSFGFGQPWRQYNTVATMSSPDSGIGYHAGHEDGIIMQVAGTRRWRVWQPAVLDEPYKLHILGCPGFENVQATITKQQPVIDTILEPGDVLYFPPFSPHEGTTLKESVSLAFGWRGLWPYFFLKGLISAVDSYNYRLDDSITRSMFTPFFEPNNEKLSENEVYSIIEDTCRNAASSVISSLDRNNEIKRAIRRRIELLLSVGN